MRLAVIERVLLGGMLAEHKDSFLMLKQVREAREALSFNDIEKATALAYQFVGKFAFDSKFGNFYYDRKNGHYSDSLRDGIDSKVLSLIHRCYIQAKNIVYDNKELVKKMATALLEKETLNQEEINELFSND